MSTELIEKIPPELHELIVDGILSIPDCYAERLQTLQSCLFVCRTFRLRARSHIFSSVSVHNKHKGYAIGRLALLRHLVEFDDGNPRSQSIAASIQHFAIVNTNGEERSKVLLDNGDLTAIMATLHSSNYGIESFALSMHAFYSISWNDLTVDFQRSFRNLCRSPHLKYLELSHLHDLPVRFFNGTYLEHLVVHGMSTDLSSDTLRRTYTSIPDKDPHARILESPPQLHSFETDHSFVFPKKWILNRNVRNLTTPLSPFTQLISFTVFMPQTSLEQSHWINMNILKSAFQSLERLSLVFVGNHLGESQDSLQSQRLNIHSGIPRNRTDEDDFHLGYLEALSYIHLSFTNKSTVTRGCITEIGLKPIIHILERSISPPNLETIEIDIFVSLRDPPGKLLAPYIVEWDFFDRIVSDFCFTSAREILLVLHFDVLRMGQGKEVDPGPKYSANVRRAVMQVLPTLREDSRFKLVIDTRVRVEAPWIPPVVPQKEGSAKDGTEGGGTNTVLL